MSKVFKSDLPPELLDDLNYYFDPSLVNTKASYVSESKTCDLTKVKDRQEYYRYKLGNKLDRFIDFFDRYTFIGYLLAPKVAGKGTYLSLLREIVGDRFVQVSVGDLVREFQTKYPSNKDEYKDLSKYYRGFLPYEEAVENALSKDVTKLIPTEFVLALIKHKIRQIGRKIIFIDGFPRTEDQVMYSLYMRDLVDFRDDPDFFVLINVPITVIDARLKFRRVCPKCGASRNLRLLPTEKVVWDKEHQEPILICDNPSCKGEKMVPKPGDEVGVLALKDRFIKDFKLMEMARKLYGIERVEIFNAVPIDIANDLVDDYEITPEFTYTYENGRLKVHTTPWRFIENNKEYYSLLAAAGILQFIKQFLEIFL